MDKNPVMLYPTSLEMFLLLKDSQAGRVVKALAINRLGGEMPKLSGVEKVAFAAMKNQSLVEEAIKEMDDWFYFRS